MNEYADRSCRKLLNRWRVMGWGTIAGLIAFPAIAMSVTNEIDWSAGDFIFAILLLGGAALLFELAARSSRSWAYRGGVGIALLSGLLLLWANGAVGIVGDEGQAINLWFNLAPLLALYAAIGARFRPEGMTVAMTATAAAQLTVGAIVQHYGHFTWVFTAVWTGAWLLSAFLFRKADRP